MSDKIKNKIITISFVVILFGVFIATILKKDETISASERRKLAQFPNINFENITSGKVAEDLDSYALDQIIFRDGFRSIKSFCSSYIFMQKDTNGLFLKDGMIYKMEYPLNNKNVKKSAEKIKSVCAKYLNENMKIYYSIIPDKNYYLNSDYLKIDVKDVQNIMKESLEKANYIDISNALNIDDYYMTDLHWKQENIQDVVKVLEENMNLNDTSNLNYQKEELGDFYGAYYGQLGMKVMPDKISILKNDTINNARAYNLEKNSYEEIYNMEKWKNSQDKYDVYLSGATPIITVENPNGPEGKELLLFRDSFGSSIAPLLLENYQKITLVDLRYVSSTILDNYIDFNNQDVLFLYSTVVLNQNILK